MKKGFTLAEVLITLSIIGVVAAITIPSVIENSQQAQFKTGLRKAVNVLNSSISLNRLYKNDTPYRNTDLSNFLQRYMDVDGSKTLLQNKFCVRAPNGSCWENQVFYTVDGMRFETRDTRHGYDPEIPLQENPDIKLCGMNPDACGGCGSLGLSYNPDNIPEDENKAPCMIVVDVNGDKKPNPANLACTNPTCGTENIYKLSDNAPDGTWLTDVFLIMITDTQAIPYGVAAQRALYGER